MGTRRDFVIAAIGTAASLSGSSGRSLALSKETDSDPLIAKTKGQQMQDQAEDPRITRARLSGPEQDRRTANVHESDGYAMDDGCHAGQTEADE